MYCIYIIYIAKDIYCKDKYIYIYIYIYIFIFVVDAVEDTDTVEDFVKTSKYL